MTAAIHSERKSGSRSGAQAEFATVGRKLSGTGVLIAFRHGQRLAASSPQPG